LALRLHGGGDGRGGVSVDDDVIGPRGDGRRLGATVQAKGEAEEGEKAGHPGTMASGHAFSIRR